MKTITIFVAFMVWLVTVDAMAQSGVTRRLSTTPVGREVYEVSTSPSISGGGRYIAFQCQAPEMALGGTSAIRNIFVKDSITGTVEQVSLNYDGSQPTGHSGSPDITPDGRYVVFSNGFSQLILGISGLSGAIYRKDRATGSVELVSRSYAGLPAGLCFNPTISDDGRYIAFYSREANFVTGDTNGTYDVFVRDMLEGTNERVSIGPGETQALNDCFDGRISGDASTVVFYSQWPLLPGDTNGKIDVYARNRHASTTALVSYSNSGFLGNGDSLSASVSRDGRFVVFRSDASNLVAGDGNNVFDVFLRDRVLQATKRLSVGPGGVEGNNGSGDPMISDDGAMVLFSSLASNLVQNDLNNEFDAFFHNIASGVNQIVSVSTIGNQIDSSVIKTAIDPTGRFAAFTTASAFATPDDENNYEDIFVYDRLGVSSLPLSYAMVRGTGTGNVSLMHASDDNRVVFDPINGIPGEPQIQLIVGSLSPVAMPEGIELYIEASATIANITVTISLYDFSSNSFVKVGVRTFGLHDKYLIMHSDNAARFIGAKGEVRAKVDFWNEWPLHNPVWQARIDHAMWSFRPAAK